MPRKGEASKRKDKPSPNSGMKGNQKMKPYLILQILQQETDENHLLTVEEIIDKLNLYGVEAERRSVGEDIKAINIALRLLDERSLGDDTLTIQDVATEMKEAEKDEQEETEKAIVYVSRNKDERGYYFRGRKFNYQQIRLLAESIYASKFLSETEADTMADVLRDYVSKYQATSIKSGVFVTDRIRTSNSDIVYSLDAIDEAISKKLNGEKHEPEKISFQYYSYSISNFEQTARRQGKRYKVSPYKVIVADGNYYLLAYDDNKKQIRTFRIDRMKGVNRIGEPREGKEAFDAIDLKNFTKRRFGMFGGRRASVRIRCIPLLLDAMVERFGTQYATYTKTDDGHFICSVIVEVSDQFFGWLLGFGNRVKLLGDEETVKELKAYLEKVKELY